jgi:hypothetical protein
MVTVVYRDARLRIYLLLFKMKFQKTTAAVKEKQWYAVLVTPFWVYFNLEKIIPLDFISEFKTTHSLLLWEFVAKDEDLFINSNTYVSL